MEKDLKLIKEAVDNLLIKQEKYMIRPNDFFITDDNIMIQEGKEWIWDKLLEEIDLIITQRRNTKLNTILDSNE